jgi:hypothetical protein
MSNRRPLVLVTYRDRLTHLNVFVTYMNRYFPNLRLAICEQADKEVWNKGLLYNAGYKELAQDYDYIILHDIDTIPAVNVDYSYTPVPTLLSTECSQYGYTYYFHTYFGGVIGINKEHYELINGFSNRFRGYGGEDDQVYRRCVEKGITPEKRLGNRFENFVHPKPDVRQGTAFWHTPDYQNNLQLAVGPIDYTDGLSSAQYKVISKTDSKEAVHLRISTI